ncbi:MAG: ATP-binding protein [Thermoplasmata archaeon HGW-Thermoplasmata-1]|nr:MAG: ATP-binding protein [Thermoplasmata archaeon HGW-Thermoplasmata-1]
MVRFINRTYEMALLSEEWAKKGARFFVIYGRRRIGKTRLIEEFMKGKNGLFYVAEDTNKAVQIRELKEKFAGFFKDDLLKRLDITNWGDFFAYLEKIVPRAERFYIAIDEFSFIVKNDKGFASAIQKFWDSFLSKTNAFLLVSGSLFGVMSEDVLSSSSPLYGRRTRDMRLRELRFRHSCEFLDMPAEEKVKVYMAIGGIPEYLLRAKDYKGADEFFKKEFISRDGYFYREPQYLLSRELKEIKTYFTILNAIAYGNTRPTDIANFAGIGTREIYPYLEALEEFGFIERSVPITGDKKSGIYVIRDAMFDFWFNFVFKNKEYIEREQAKIEKTDLNAYFGKRFEFFIRDDVLPGLLPEARIGRWWYKDTEIDLVALEEEKAFFFECKWSDLKESEARGILAALREKAKLVGIKDNKAEIFGLFAKKIEGKEKLLKEGFMAFDLEDALK